MGHYSKAPAHSKPPLPPGSELAERLCNGELLSDIAIEYHRTPERIAFRLNQAGYTRSGVWRIVKVRPPPVPLTLRSLEWIERGACAEVDPALFFPEVGDLGAKKKAKRVCKGCDVATECLTYALDNDEEYGVWGGTTPTERHRLTRSAS